MSEFDQYAHILGPGFDAAVAQFATPEDLRSREFLAAYAHRPVEFIREVMGKPVQWEAQRYSARALMAYRKLVVCSCRKSSKTEQGANLVDAIVCTAPTRCIVTSATGTQVRENLWSKIRKNHAGSKYRLPGRLGVTSLRITPDWYAIGISTNQPGNVMGFHADVTLPPELDMETPEELASLPPPDPRAADEDHARAERNQMEVLEETLWKWRKTDDKARLFYVLDEFSQMDAEILRALEGSWMGDFYVYAPFNPTFSADSGHPAAKALQPGSDWHRVHIAGREPPEEAHGPQAGEDGSLFDRCFHGVPKELMPDAWVDQIRNDFGDDDPQTMANLYGLPSSQQADRQMIPFRLLRNAFEILIKSDRRPESRHIGYDVAGSSKGDWNVAQCWDCGELIEEDQWRHPDTAKSRERVLELLHRWGVNGKPIPARNLHIDATGGSMGKAMADEMRAGGHWVDAVDFGSEPVGEWVRLLGPDRYFVSRKAELIWVVRVALQKGIAKIPRRFRDTVIQAQWYTYKEVARHNGTAIGVQESKDDIFKLYGRSPDNFEAATLAWSRTGRKPVFMSANRFSDIARRLNQ